MRTDRAARRRFSTRFLALAVALCSLAFVALASGCSQAVSAEMRTMAGVNAIRTQAGLPPLRPDAALVGLARTRSADMAANRYFSHTPPSGCNAICMMDQLGIARAWAGENIEWNNWDWPQTADSAVRTWQNSPGHMENILNCHYTRAGVGVAASDNGRIYFTMVYEGNAGC